MAKSAKIDYVIKPFRAPSKANVANLDHTNLSFCDQPPPEVIFEGRAFCLTGVFGFEDGERNRCEDAVRARGGVCWHHPSHDLDYLVIGTFVESAWAHKGYGRKIEAALELKRNGAKCKIVSEAHWVKSLRNTPELPAEKRISICGQSRSYQIVELQRKLEEMRRNQKAMVEILRCELEPSAFRKISRRLSKSGIVV